MELWYYVGEKSGSMAAIALWRGFSVGVREGQKGPFSGVVFRFLAAV
jgi:hypothetical protein